ncbi:MAG: PD-(D/E)XK nuclease family protein [Gammaproteobacteria bacterium]|nr:PD-(D/E)XK nuclease family protein [Gammaproteobacteria bacterium]
MNQPNLFSYATSELSQDAFICWLLSWASPELKGSDKGLHECAINLIKSLFDKHKISIPSNIEQVEVRKQDNNIDVLCIINNTYPILIEDKTGTKHHSNQLTRYLEDVKNRDFKEQNIIPIYFKTEDQASYSSVEENGYKPYLREDFLKILNAYNGVNAILVDYRSHLKSISDKVESYKSKEISKWGRYAWIGFYLELQKQLGSGHWDYVANPAGGFLGFWWHFQGTDNCKQYLQLEQDKFCFKIWVKNENERRLLRSKWHKILNDKVRNNKDTGFNLIKPGRFGSGKYMTVCVFDGEYREVEDGVIDIGKTIELFRKAENFLKSVNKSA